VLDELMSSVGRDFELKCLGEAKPYLGIDLYRYKDGNFLIFKPTDIETIIDVARLSNAKISKFPLDTRYHKLDGKELGSNKEYQKLIGMLLYLSTNSRPDIAASVSILSQRVQNPQDIDLSKVKRVIRCLKGTHELKLHLSSSNRPSKLYAFSDSDKAESRQDRKSHSGLYCFVNGGATMWSCR
jgi:hypothetical protein